MRRLAEVRAVPRWLERQETSRPCAGLRSSWHLDPRLQTRKRELELHAIQRFRHPLDRHIMHIHGRHRLVIVTRYQIVQFFGAPASDEFGLEVMSETMKNLFLGVDLEFWKESAQKPAVYFVLWVPF